MVTEAQKAALAKARAARSGMSTGAGAMNIGSSLTQLNKQFENIQNLERLTQQFWKDAKPYLGQTGTQTRSTGSTGTRGGTPAQHAKAGRKGGKASHSGGGGVSASTG